MQEKLEKYVYLICTYFAYFYYELWKEQQFPSQWFLIDYILLRHFFAAVLQNELNFLSSASRRHGVK